MKKLFLPALVAFASSLGAVTASQAAEKVRISAELAQSVMPEGRDGRVFLRVSLEGVHSEEAEGGRVPANVMLVIDRSGSMQGERIEQAKEAALMAVERLGEDDVLGVVTYSNDASVLSPADHLRDTAAIRSDIRGIRAHGRTALYAGVSQGIRELSDFVDPYKVNRIILLSDGLANVGPSSPQDLQDLGREAAQQGITVTTIGLGLGYNEDLMTQLALASDGNHAFVEHPDDLVEIFNAEFGDVLTAIGGDAEIIIECPDGFEPVRVLGREANIDGHQVRMKMNQIYGKQQKYVMVELKVDQDRAKGLSEAAKVEVNYTDLASKKRASTSSKAEIRFSGSEDEVSRSVNKEVMAAVATQIATEQNEKAVSLRDEGKVEEAKKLLKDNAAYLQREAEALPAEAAASLNDLSKKNLNDAENLTGSDWAGTRKSMRARQYKDKTQQSY